MVTNELTTSRATPLQVARARGRVRGRLILLGPAFVAAVAYVDPRQLRHQLRRRRAT